MPDSSPALADSRERQPPRVTRWAVLLVIVVMVLLARWTLGNGDADVVTQSADTTPGAEVLPDTPQSVGEPSEAELGSGWDTPGDAPVADPLDLGEDQRRTLLRVEATLSGSPESCAPGDVTFALSGFDVAMGHRFTHLALTNTSGDACTVQGYAGIGGYGRWGSTFLWEAAQRPVTGTPQSGEYQPVVTLSPGATALADLQWRGELAGAESEWLWAFAIQLTRDQAPAIFVPPGEDPLVRSGSAGGSLDEGDTSEGDHPLDQGDPDAARTHQHLEDLDIGMLTTVDIGGVGAHALSGRKQARSRVSWNVRARKRLHFSGGQEGQIPDWIHSPHTTSRVAHEGPVGGLVFSPKDARLPVLKESRNR